MFIVRFSNSLILCFLLVALAAHAQVAAVVSDQVGPARYQVKGDWKDLGVLTSLPSGAVVDVAKGAKSSLSFVKGGRVVQLQGPCRAKVTPDGVKALEGQSRIEVTNVARIEGSQMPRSVNFDQMGGLVRVDEKTAPHTTSESVARNGEPLITWNFAGASEAFAVTVLDAETEDEVLRLELEPEARSAQLSGLEAGREYTVLLATRTSDNAYESEHPLRVLSSNEQELLEQWEEKAKTEEFAAQVLLLSLYLEKELWNDALTLSRKLREERPTDPNLLFLEELLSKQ